MCNFAREMTITYFQSQPLYLPRLYSFGKHLFKVTNKNTITTSLDVNLLSLSWNRYLPTAQPVFTCSKLTIETLKQGVKYVQR